MTDELHIVEWISRYALGGDGLVYVVDQAVVMSDGSRRELGPPPEPNPGMRLEQSALRTLGIADTTRETSLASELGRHVLASPRE